MDRARWQRVGELFETLSGLEGEALERALVEHCGDDEALRREVVSLLEADTDAEAWLAGLTARSGIPAPEAEATLNVPGRTIGAWRLVRQIGRGGMGVVYLAERADDQFHMQAALKALPVGLITPEAVTRFKREREILAQLDHPHIARLLDGGVTPEGTPFYVMEYVEGLTLHRYCQGRAPSLDDRIRLFEQIASAVAYAHRHLVIHRDIKPANVLVTESGEPKLLDFGVAKLVEAEAEDTRTATQVAHRRVTPAYTAPELLQGEPVTTACDVYSLGVVLYELLAGKPPFEPGFFDQPGWTDRLAGYRPIPPSKAAEDGVLNPRLQGDLDTIVAMAMHPDPARRYATVNALLKDLERNRRQLPVAARPDTLRYRASRFVRRHAVGVGLSGLAAASLITGAGLALWQAQEATHKAAAAAQAAQRAQTTRDFLLRLFDAADPANTRGASLTAEQLVDTAAGMVRAGAGTSPELRVTLSGTVAGLYRRLGLLDKARAVVDARYLDEQLLRRMDPGAGARFLIERARVSWRSGDFKAAKAALQRAEHVLESCGQCRATYILVGAARAALQREQGYPTKSVKSYETLVDEALTRPELDALEQSDILLGYAASLGKIDEYGAAERILLHARELLRETGQSAPLREAQIWHELGAMQLLRFERADAKQSFERALAIREEILDQNHPATLQTLNRLAGLRNLAGDYAGARRVYESVLQRQRASLGPEHPALVETLIDIGYTHHNAGEFDKALASIRQAWELAEQVYAPDSTEHWDTVSNLAWMQVLNGRYEKAEPTYRKMLAQNRERYGAQHPRVANTLESLGWMSYFQGKFSASEDYFKQASTVYEKVYPDDHIKNFGKIVTLPRIRIAMGKLKGAEETLRRARELATEDAPSQEALAQLGIGQARLRRGDATEALPMLEDSFEKLGDMHGADHVLTLEAQLSLARAHQALGNGRKKKKHVDFVWARLKEHVGGREYLVPRLEEISGTEFVSLATDS